MINSHDEFAIVGAALRIAQTTSLEEYWDWIVHKRDGLREFPKNRRRDTDEYLRRTKQEALRDRYIPGAYLESIDGFDYRFFRIPFKEAKLMDPNQRLMLQTAYQAVENAGYGGNALRRRRVGVYIGYNAGLQLYGNAIKAMNPDMKELAFAGNESSVIAGRIAYFLDSIGPALMIDCACSSSLMALHTACAGLRNGDCEAALVGAVSLKMLLLDDIERLGTVSDDYRTRTFDRFSNGTGPGEGVVAVLVKPYTQALKDGDAIHAIIKGSAVNHNGHTIGITAPSVSSQEDVIVRAWETAGICPEDIGFIEAHGTATRLGDPMEILSLKKAFARYTSRRQFCGISSVKTNFGHLKSAAGLAALVKCVMAIKNAQIPPSNHFHYPNPQINFHRSPMYINDRVRQWIPSNNRYVCAVSSFGINGTNCHFVLMNDYASESIHQDPGFRPDSYLFALSAVTMRSLNRLIWKYDEYLSEHTADIADLCFTLQTGRGHHQHRLAIHAKDISELKEKLHDVNCKGLYCKLPDGVLYERCKKSSYTPTDLMSGSIADLNSNDLAEMYCRGINIPWDVLYKSFSFHRLHLPEYEYDESRCWLYDTTYPEAYDLYETRYQMDAASSGPVKRQENQPSGHVLLVANTDKKSDVSFIDGFATQLHAEVWRIEEAHTDEPNCGAKSSGSLVNMVSRFNTVGVPIETIIYLNMCRQPITPETFYSLISALGSYADKNAVKRFVCVTCMSANVLGSEESAPNHAYLYGIMKTAVWEYPQIRFRGVDLESWLDIACIMDEMTIDDGAFAVAYRKGTRYIEILRKMEQPLRQSPALPLIENGVYVITGGLGGVGMEIAQHLVNRGATHIALLSRSGCITEDPDASSMLSEKTSVYIRQAERIKQWKLAGVNVVVMKADVTSESQMEKAFSQLRQRYGAICGVFHCAANSEGGCISDIPYETFIQWMAPKVRGVHILEKITREDTLDFFVVFSSAITIIGGYGSAAYVAANAYLVAFAQAMRRRKITVIQWPAWLHTGIAERTKIDVERELFSPLQPVEATHAMETIITSGIPSAIVGRIYKQSLVFELGKQLPFVIENDGEQEVQGIVPECRHKYDVHLTGRDDDRYSPLERKIATAWAGFLETNEIDLDDNFFELGGDSISAIRIVNEIKSGIDGHFELRDFLGHPMIKAQAKHLEEKIECSVAGLAEISPPDGDYPTSAAQRRMFLHNYMQPDSLVYNLPEAIDIKGPIDIERLIATLQATLKAHEIFSTSLHIKDDSIVQRIHDNILFDIPVCMVEPDEIDHAIQSFLNPFQLETPPLFRCKILKISNEHHILMYDVHHALFDGVSRDLLIRSLMLGYAGEAIVQPQVQYKHYAVWQEYQRKNSQEFKSQKKYWIGKIRSVPALHEQSSDTSQFDENKGKRLIFYIKTDLVEKMTAFSAQNAGTLFMFLLAIYALLRHETTHKQWIAVATSVEGRSDSRFQSTMGMFVNTLIMINKINPELRFIDYYRQVVSNAIDDLSNQEYQVDDLISDLQISRSWGQFPIFDTMLVLQAKGFGMTQSTEGITMSGRSLVVDRVKFPCALEAVRMDSQIKMHFDYCTSIYSMQVAESLCRRIISLITIALNDPERTLRDILHFREKEADNDVQNTSAADFDF